MRKNKNKNKDWVSIFANRSPTVSSQNPVVSRFTEYSETPTEQSIHARKLKQFKGSNKVSRKPLVKEINIPEDEIDLEELGLENAIHLFGPFFIYAAVYKKLSYSFESVVFISLFTKLYGRLIMISGLITPATQGIGHFLLTNLLFGAGPIMMIAAIIRFVYVLAKDLYAGKSWSEALTHASIEAIKTAIKFFIVYMVWTLAIALCTSLGILSGGLLPLGILVVAIIVTIGFMLATFIVDKLPGILMDLKGSWANFKNKLSELKEGILPALLEGGSWTLMDNDLVSISGHIAGFIGKAIDLIAVSIIVSGLFFLGAVIYSTLDRYFKINRRAKEIRCPEQKKTLQRTVSLSGSSPFTTLKRMKQIQQNNPDSRLQAATVEYRQADMILKIINKLENSPIPIKIEDLISLDEKAWFRFSPASISASSGRLTLQGQSGQKDYDMLAQISVDLHSTDQSTKRKAKYQLQLLKTKNVYNHTMAFNKLQQHSLFAANKQVVRCSTGQEEHRDIIYTTKGTALDITVTY